SAVWQRYRRNAHRVSPGLRYLVCVALSSVIRGGSHQELHSFPTRRSSDLSIWKSKRGKRSGSSEKPGAGKQHSFGNYYVSIHWRSEEHTSELQSRFDLVCRLLLEKKKNEMETTESITRIHTIKNIMDKLER